MRRNTSGNQSAFWGVLLAVLAILGGHEVQAQQVGNAFLVFDISTGRLSMNPGNTGGTGPGQVNSYGIEASSDMVFNGTASFPSGNSFFPPTNTSTLIGDAFFNLTAPDVVPNATHISTSNLRLTSSSGKVIPSAILGFVGTPEWNFGNVGPTNLTHAQALNGLGASTQGGLATGNRIYSLVGQTGTQQFRVYTIASVPEPAITAPVVGGLVGLGMVALKRRRR
ncbi:MAG: PEP-CTERM sorting domain-containing protein [Planctomycetes bacterium]|nr:PEP-CTERM sorting domain-containing protein [Planctomycetota bacterium]